MLRAAWVGLIMSGSALAQAPVADPRTPSVPALPPSATTVLTAPTSPVAPQMVVVEDPAPPLRLRGSFDFLVGSFTGVRYQTAPLFDGGRWSGEVFGGFAAVVLPGAGVGIRRRAYATGDATDALGVAPGIGAYVLFEPWGWRRHRDDGTLGGAVSFDVDFTWTHAFSRTFDATLGVKAGAAVVFGRGGVVPFPVPVFGVYFGCGF